MATSSFAKGGNLRKILETPLFSFPGQKKDKWTIGDATMGTQIFGATGSGKSSGSGKMLAKSFLKNGFGGLILCAKPDERQVWENYIREIDRERDMVIFTKYENLDFNPLMYEKTRKGRGGGETINIVNMIMNIYQLGQSFMSGGSGRDSEQFWQNSVRRCITRIVDLINLTKTEKLSFSNMRRIVESALEREDIERYNEISKDINEVWSELKDFPAGTLHPEFEERRDMLNKKADALYDELGSWREENYCLDCLLKAYSRDDFSDDEQYTYDMVHQYFFKTFAFLSERTRSIIVESLLGFIEPFFSGLLKEHFTDTVSDDLRPEACYLENKIIILDFPIKQYLISGVYAQGLYKYIWQQAMERRQVEFEKNPKPVFLWVDECQFFINPEYDALFQSTARSSLICTVFLSQNINNIFFAMGQNNPEYRAQSLLGNLITKIFHANTDFKTNQYASEMIGQYFREMSQSNMQTLNPERNSLSYSEQLHHHVLPSDFTTLEAGGRKENNYHTEAIIVTTSRKWHDGKNYLRVKFDQNY